MTLGKVNGEEIIEVGVYGIEQDYTLKCFRSYADAYEFIQECKKFDRKEGFKDIYMLELYTKENVYGLYQLMKTKKGWKLR